VKLSVILVPLKCADWRRVEYLFLEKCVKFAVIKRFFWFFVYRCQHLFANGFLNHGFQSFLKYENWDFELFCENVNHIFVRVLVSVLWKFVSNYVLVFC